MNETTDIQQTPDAEQNPADTPTDDTTTPPDVTAEAVGDEVPGGEALAPDEGLDQPLSTSVEEPDENASAADEAAGGEAATVDEPTVEDAAAVEEPSAEEAAAVQEPSAEEAAAVQEPSAEEAAAVAEQAVAVDEPTVPQDPAGTGTDSAPDVALPRRSSRSRRATRPTSAPEHDAASPSDPLDVLAELGSPAREADRATDRGRPAGDAADALGRIIFEGPGRAGAGAGEESSRRRAPEGPAVAPLDRSGDEAAVAVAHDPRLPVTALLFQAPDLSPRPRRAQAPAGPPSAPPGQAAEAGEMAPLEHEGDQAEDVEDERQEADDEGGAAGGQRRRRRRGGRGRRSRSSGGPSEDGGSESEQDDVEQEDESDRPDVDAPVREEAAEAAGTSGRRRRGRRGSDAGAAAPGASEGQEPTEVAAEEDETSGEEGAGSAVEPGSSRRRRRRRRSGRSGESEDAVLESVSDEVTALKGSTRLEAKRQRRREGRDAGRRRTVVTEAEFLARRESVERSMVVRERGGRTQIAVLEDGVLVEHFVARRTQTSMVGNVYLGRVQNVLPSMEAAFVDLGKGRNAVLYAGEVNWDAAGMEGQPRRIEQALSSGDSVMVQVTKDPIGHKGARLTSQITLAGRYLVLVPSGAMTGISRKLPDTERARLKKLLREIVPEGAGVIVRTAAEGASEEELRLDVARLQVQWAEIERKAKGASAPALLHGEPDLAIRVVRDVFNEDFGSVTIAGDEAWDAIAGYIESIAPDLAPRLHRWTSPEDVFAAHRIDEQLAKALERKVWLPSGGSLVIDRTEAMTVIDVNTGKFTGAGGTLEETVTKNNLEAAEEIVRQLRLRDIGGIIVIDFIDMVLESNRDLVLRRLVECLGRDRTRHQVAEVTSLGLVQMTRKRVGQGLLEAFSETCEVCGGRGYILHNEPVEKPERPAAAASGDEGSRTNGRRRGRRATDAAPPVGSLPHPPAVPEDQAAREAVKATLATIAAAAAHAHEGTEPHPARQSPALAAVDASARGGADPDVLIDFDLIRSADPVDVVHADEDDAPAHDEGSIGEAQSDSGGPEASDTGGLEPGSDSGGLEVDSDSGGLEAESDSSGLAVDAEA